MGTLSQEAIERVSGPAWTTLRPAFLDISEKLLAVAPEAVGSLTTIYVKYQVSAAPNANVFAVVWLKTAKNIVVGLSLPDDCKSPKYRGLTGYFQIKPGMAIPDELPKWAAKAYQKASAD
jgi:hypothetical protein